MPTTSEIARLSAAANLLRPDWPEQSIRTYLLNNHLHRPYRDLALALAYVATDDETRTPKRLDEHGPWWALDAQETPTPPHMCRECRYPHDPSRPDQHPVPLGEEGTRRAVTAAREAAVAARRITHVMPPDRPR